MKSKKEAIDLKIFFLEREKETTVLAGSSLSLLCEKPFGWRKNFMVNK